MSTNMSAPPELIERLERVQMRALVAGVIGLAAGFAAWAVWPVHFFPAYLVGFLYWLGISLGCVGLIMLHHLVGGSWGLVIRRPLESGAMNVLPLAVLFVPIAFGISSLYPWARGGSADHAAVGEHTLYLSESFFLIRAAIYFVIWIAMGLTVNGLSNRQDATTNARAQPLAPGNRGARDRAAVPGGDVFGDRLGDGP